MGKREPRWTPSGRSTSEGGPSALVALAVLVAVAALVVAISLTDSAETGHVTTSATSIVDTPTADAELGTVTPAYPPGIYLEPGVEVLERIPISDLSTTGHTQLNQTDPCVDIPHEIVTPAEVFATPARSDEHGCQWTGSHGLTISSHPATAMAKHVEHSAYTATDHHSTSAGRLSHLAWLRIDGHYATEHIDAGDPTATCHLTIDLSSPRVVTVGLRSLGYITRKPVDTNPSAAVGDFCPTARAVAKNLVRHLDSRPAGPAGGAVPSPSPTR